MDIFGGYHKIGLLHLEVISMHLRVFSEGQDTEWSIFIGLINFFKFLFGMIFFWGGGVNSR